MARLDDLPPAYMVFHPVRGIEGFYKTREDARAHVPDAVDYIPRMPPTPDAVDYIPRMPPTSKWLIATCAPTVQDKYGQYWSYHRREIEDDINSDQSGEDRDVYAETVYAMRDWGRYVWSHRYQGMVLSLGNLDTHAYLAKCFPLTQPRSESGQAAYVDVTPKVAELDGYALDVDAVRAYARSPSPSPSQPV